MDNVWVLWVYYFDGTRDVTSIVGDKKRGEKLMRFNEKLYKNIPGYSFELEEWDVE